MRGMYQMSGERSQRGRGWDPSTFGVRRPVAAFLSTTNTGRGKETIRKRRQVAALQREKGMRSIPAPHPMVYIKGPRKWHGRPWITRRMRVPHLLLARSKPLPVFARADERLHHFGL